MKSISAATVSMSLFVLAVINCQAAELEAPITATCNHIASIAAEASHHRVLGKNRSEIKTALLETYSEQEADMGALATAASPELWKYGMYYYMTETCRLDTERDGELTTEDKAYLVEFRKMAAFCVAKGFVEKQSFLACFKAVKDRAAAKAAEKLGGNPTLAP